MWGRYDAEVVRDELAVLARLGCTLTRSFCYWPEFMPEPELLDPEIMERFEEFLDLHDKAGMWTVPTFIVGHMSGQNWDPSWRGGRDLYRDVWLLGQQAWFVEAVAKRVAHHPAIAAWLLSNEMPLYGKDGDEEVVTAWARILVNALRAGGATQPVSTGDGAWGAEISGNDNGFSLRRLAPIVDFYGPHVYTSSDDPVRQMFAAAFACEMASSFGKPVVLEEFGLSSDMVSGENAAHYYRQVLHGSLIAGARGWLAWNNCDYDSLAQDDPYRHHAFELHFGIIDHSGNPKPQANELARFAHLVTELARQGWQKSPSAVALVVPEHLESTDPTWSRFARSDIQPNLFQAYIAAREAGLPVSVLRERDMTARAAQWGDSGPKGGLPEAQLYIMPCAKFSTTNAVQVLLAAAAAGATIYASYFAGSTPGQPGPWFPWLEQVFGVTHRLRYGLVDEIEDDAVVFSFVADLGDIPAGTELRFPVAAAGRARSYLPVEAVTAEVLALDQRGRPALLRNPNGEGSTVLSTYPLEHLAASRPDANPEDTWRLYSALATAASVPRPVRADDPHLVIGGLVVGGKEAFVALNASPDEATAGLLAPGRSITPMSVAPGGRLSGNELSLGPYGVAVFYAEPSTSGL